MKPSSFFFVQLFSVLFLFFFFCSIVLLKLDSRALSELFLFSYLIVHLCQDGALGVTLVYQVCHSDMSLYHYLDHFLTSLT